jgi:hypothetical protein
MWYASSNAEWRAVPHRYRELPSTALADTDWEAVDVPVGIAFFFYNSALQRVVAMYPSPVGVTESSLASTALERALEAAGRDIEPDVEALLVRRTRDASELFIVPIDACYELAGRVRMHWRGFGGGEETRNAIDAFFAMLRDRAVLSAGGDAN